MHCAKNVSEICECEQAGCWSWMPETRIISCLVGSPHILHVAREGCGMGGAQNTFPSLAPTSPTLVSWFAGPSVRNTFRFPQNVIYFPKAMSNSFQTSISKINCFQSVFLQSIPGFRIFKALRVYCTFPSFIYFHQYKCTSNVQPGRSGLLQSIVSKVYFCIFKALRVYCTIPSYTFPPM